MAETLLIIICLLFLALLIFTFKLTERSKYLEDRVQVLVLAESSLKEKVVSLHFELDEQQTDTWAMIKTKNKVLQDTKDVLNQKWGAEVQTLKKQLNSHAKSRKIRKRIKRQRYKHEQQH